MNDYERLFARLTVREPNPSLLPAILSRIELERVKVAKIRFAVLGATFLASLTAIIPAFQFASQELSISGFTQYLSLISYDGWVLLTYWREFSLTLVESLPIVGLTVFAVTFFVMVSSLRLALKNMVEILYQPKQFNLTV